jgi:coronin-1B/1C/6
MSGRFVRQSKFRHVFGSLNKKEKAYQSIKPALAGEGNFIASSVWYTAVPLQGGGGPVQIIRNGAYEKYTTSVGKLSIHKNVVLDCAFSPYDQALLATGDDVGQINITRLPQPDALPAHPEKPDAKNTEGYTKAINDTTALVNLPDCHSKKVAILSWNPNFKNILGSCGFDNVVKVFDVEAGKNIHNLEQPDQPYHIDWSSDGSKMAVMRKDKTIAIIDPRDHKSEIKAEGLDSKPGRVVWADPARKLIATGVKGGSRVIAVYDPKKFNAPLSVVDVDQGGSVLTPYYDPDTSVLFLPGKGDATLRYYEVSEKDEGDQYCFSLADFRDNESSKGGCFLPKTACDVLKSEIAIFYRLMRDWVSPISFVVPRKSDQFQADLFPDTYHGPAHEAKEYEHIAGKEKPFVKRSMKPSAEAPAAPQRSRADVERELESAKNKVKILEAELANFK